MDEAWLHGVDPWVLRRAALIFPNPVAVACGRMLRSRTPQEVVDATLKAAEILTRYLAGAALASWAVRDEGLEAAILEPSGNLAFGTFLALVQQVALQTNGHPLAPHLSAMRRRKKGLGMTDEALVALLGLRNDLGHDLSALQHPRALTILEERNPIQLLAQAFQGVESILALPLFVAEDCRYERRVYYLRRLLLMGESADPAPEEIRLKGPVEQRYVPYIATGEHLLPLPPLVRWSLIRRRQNYALLFLDGVPEKGGLHYASLHADELDEGTPEELSVLFREGERREPESAVLEDGRSLDREWGERRRRREDTARLDQGSIPWEAFDRGILRWFAARLSGDSPAEPAGVIREHLLDGRDIFEPDEIRQMVLLWGQEPAVRRQLRRDVLDIRQLKEGDTRFSERLLVGKNLFTSLREALEFFSRAIQLEGASLDSLSRTEGSADYIALREGLVNQFIHQDYTSSQAAAQIDLRPRRAILFNPGHSLVPTRQLPDGGRSQARNPLIARAFRLVGFAELGGSGLTSLQRVWRIARRRPPRFESSPESNSFSLTLSWEPLAPDVDVAWQKRLGAVLSAREASALNLVLSAGALSLQEIASGTELDVETVEAIVTRLKVQRLLELDDGEKVRASESAQEAWSRGQD